MTFSTCPFRMFAVLLFVISTAFAAKNYSATAQRQTAHAAIITVTPETNKAKLEDFSWLAGRWEGKLGPLPAEKQMTAEQQWMAPRNGTMQGSFRLTNSEKTLVIEFFTLRETPNGIVLYFRHFSPELKPWEEVEAYHLNLTKADAGTFRFDNPVVNQLKDAILTRVDNDTYISHGDITGDDGKPTVIEITYHRVK
jgi:Domain of unknown function (DUF6265)